MVDDEEGDAFGRAELVSTVGADVAKDDVGDPFGRMIGFCREGRRAEALPPPSI